MNDPRAKPVEYESSRPYDVFSRPKRMVHCILLFLGGVFVLPGCSEKAPGGTAEEIAAAYADALIDGAYATRLLPFIHPGLRESMPENRMFTDREPSRESSVLGSTLRQFRIDEMESLERWFTFPITPTHVLMISQDLPQDDKSTMIADVPIYLLALDERYLVVFGLMKSHEEIEVQRTLDRFRFRVDPEGLWRDAWELQFAADSEYNYTLRMREAEADIDVVTILSSEEIAFSESTKRLNFWLTPQGADDAYRRANAGDYRVPFGYQAGRNAGSSAFNLDADEITAYAANSTLEFRNDILQIATFAGVKDGGAVTFVVELVRAD